MRNFKTDRNGNVAILFALALIPVIGAMGAAVDYSLASAQRTAMQAAIDATALALAKIMPASQAELDARGMEFFKANLGSAPIKNVTLSITPANGKLNLEAAATYTPELVNVLGITEFPIGTKAEARWGIKKLELALALDNTGSMSWSGKMTALKKATHNLLDMLESAVAKPGDAKVAIIPFDTTVKIGTGYKDEFWVDYKVNDIKKKDWEGCVIDREQDYDVTDTAPTNNGKNKRDTWYPAADCGSLVQMLPLTDDWKQLSDRVDQMTPNGFTNVTIGLAWAWHALTSTEVLTQAAAPDPELEKYIVLLTDGANTKNRWTSNQSQIDARTKLACKNAKAAGIKIFAVRVIEGNADLLLECATNPSMYFDVQQADQLIGVFNSIGSTLANLHLSK